jgi:hypothetical protein
MPEGAAKGLNIRLDHPFKRVPQDIGGFIPEMGLYMDKKR